MGKTVMIVEDEQAFHDLYTMMLEDTDYEIIRAYDGDEALAKLEEKKTGFDYSRYTVRSGNRRHILPIRKRHARIC